MRVVMRLGPGGRRSWTLEQDEVRLAIELRNDGHPTEAAARHHRVQPGVADVSEHQAPFRQAARVVPVEMSRAIEQILAGLLGKARPGVTCGCWATARAADDASRAEAADRSSA